MKLNVRQLLLLILSFSGNFAAQPKASIPNISTLQEALFNIRKVILNAPVKDAVAFQVYEKQQSSVLVACAKVLYDNAQQQILQILQEIDKRIAYWRYQKNHPWNYFVAKNPLKWFTGQPQKAEIEHNLEQLLNHQGELYVLLGRLAEEGNVYDHQYKTLFVTDYTKAYAWVDELLTLLSRIKVTLFDRHTMSSFMLRANLLKLKLVQVRSFKNDILAEMKDTEIPTHLARNWLKYAILLSLFGQGYKYADQIGEFALTSLGRKKEYIVSAVENVKDIFFPGKLGREGLLVQQSNIDEAHSEMIKFLDLMEKNKIITDVEKKVIIADEAKGNTAEFQKFMNEKIMSSNWYFAKYGVNALNIFLQLLSFHGGGHIEKEISGLRNVALLAPAALAGGIVGGLGYMGYKKFTVKDYSGIRRALVDINSLFVDQTKPLDDEKYGKMLYLVYNLKQRAQKDVPLIDQADFIEDLNNIESKEFDVAAKRRIVDDMFRKYSFLR